MIVPELGGFVLQNQPAVITSDSIEPPLAVISFNPLMKISDGLLAIELSRAEQISFREAVQLINTAVDSAKTILEKGKQLDMGSLGFLATNTDKKIIFTPADDSNFIPSNFGLTTLHMSARQQIVEEERRVIKIVLPSRRNMIKYAAAVALIAGLFFGAPKLNDAYRNLGSLNPTTLLNQDNKKIEEPIVREVKAPEMKTQELVVVAPEANHHVIVSCMATQQDADDYCQWLKSLNYEKAHILPPIKTYRVAIESFVTKEEAVAFMQNLRKTKPQFAEAWVLSE